MPTLPRAVSQLPGQPRRPGRLGASVPIPRCQFRRSLDLRHCEEWSRRTSTPGRLEESNLGTWRTWRATSLWTGLPVLGGISMCAATCAGCAINQSLTALGAVNMSRQTTVRLLFRLANMARFRHVAKDGSSGSLGCHAYCEVLPSSAAGR